MIVKKLDKRIFIEFIPLLLRILIASYMKKIKKAIENIIISLRENIEFSI